MPVDLRPALKMPVAPSGQRIGLFGGSFNPPHAGHVHVSETALRRAGLDRIWWIVTPGNPLKDHSNLASLEDRLRACRAITNNPAIHITAFEAANNLQFTVDTIDWVIRRNKQASFVWLMGADNLAGFHKWHDWRGIAARLPIVVIDRPGSTLAHLSAPAAIGLSKYRISEANSRLITDRKSPAWTFIHAPRSSLSSTAIRNRDKSVSKPC